MLSSICQEGKGSPEEVVDGEEEVFGTNCGMKKEGGGGEGGKKGEVTDGWVGGLMLLIFHQLGFPAIICCTGELCKLTPLFMPLIIF